MGSIQNFELIPLLNRATKSKYKLSSVLFKAISTEGSAAGQIFLATSKGVKRLFMFFKCLNHLYTTQNAKNNFPPEVLSEHGY